MHSVPTNFKDKRSHAHKFAIPGDRGTHRGTTDRVEVYNRMQALTTPGDRLCTPMSCERPASFNSVDSDSHSWESARLVALCVHADLEKLAPQLEKPRLNTWQPPVASLGHD
eukprot:jgi/Mesvir1/6593/Mv03888-RA.1